MSTDRRPLPHPRLDVCKQTLHFEARTGGRLPDWLGSAWRGGFGRELKSLVCVTGFRACEPCGLYRQCPYPGIFETPPDPAQAKMRKYSNVPRPYALLPSGGGELAAGQSLRLELRLFGHAIQHRALLVDALIRAGARGLGRDQLPLLLSHAESPTTETLCGQPPATALPGNLMLRLSRPLRLRVRGKPVGPANLEFGDFFSALLRRISMLCTFHQEPFEVDFRRLVDQARSIGWLHSDLRLAPLKRYSNRQRRVIDLSGLVGSLVLPTTDIQPLLPYLHIGQHTLVGRGAVMGLGEYSIQFTD